jgi:hypothetical protein
MSITESHELPNLNPSTEQQEATASGCATGRAQPDEPSAEALPNQAEGQGTPSAETSDSGEGRKANSEQRPANGEERTANSEKRRTTGEERSADANRADPAGVRLCRHIMEDGVYCQVPALTGRPYCYRHLRLRGQQMRIARALAQRQSFQLLLPPLEDLNAVQSALIHVTAALAARLLDRHHAGQLLYALQQAASNLRFQAKAQSKAANLTPQAGQLAATPEALGAPPFSPASGERVSDEHVVEEYPEFEAEFGLPAGLDLTLPPQVAFPPADKAMAAAQTPGIHPRDRWTKEAIALEELDDRRSQMDEKSYSKQANKLNDKLRQRADTYIRKQREAEWEAEAARRNAMEEEKAQQWRSMDAAQQRAFMEGVMTGREEEAAEQREKARQKKPVASLEREEAIVGMGELPERGE